MSLSNVIVSHLTPIVAFLDQTSPLRRETDSVASQAPSAASLAHYLNDRIGSLTDFSEGEDGWYISRKAELFTALRDIPRSGGIELIWFIPDEASESTIRKLAVNQMVLVAHSAIYIIGGKAGRRASPASIPGKSSPSEAELHPLVNLAHEMFFTLIEVSFNGLCDKRAILSCEGAYMYYPSRKAINRSWVGTIILPTGVSLITKPPFPGQQGLVVRWRPIRL